MDNKNMKVPHTKALKHARTMMDKGEEVSDIIQETDLSHRPVMKMLNNHTK